MRILSAKCAKSAALDFADVYYALYLHCGWYTKS